MNYHCLINGGKAVERETITYYLGQPEMEKLLWERADYLRRERLKYKNKEDEIKSEIAYGKQTQVNYGNESARTNNKSDLFDTYISTMNMLKKYDMELLDAYEDVMDKIAECKRINLIYEILPFEEKKIMDELYVKKSGWKAVEIDLCLNHKTLVNKVAGIFDLMCRMYESETLTNAKIARQAVDMYKGSNIKKDKKENMEGQTTVYDFFGRRHDEENE